MVSDTTAGRMVEGKVVVVIGAGGLLGRDFVRGIAEGGGHPVLADIVEPQTSEHLAIRVDINSKASVMALISAVHARYGRIDAVVNSAYPRNAQYGRKFFDVTHEDFCENISLNLGGMFLVCQKMAEYFQKQGYGNIINIASIYGVTAPKFEIYENTEMTMPVEYAAIKSAVIHLTKYMAKYLKGSDIRVNSISPGGILDKQPKAFLAAYQKLCNDKGMLDPVEITNALLFLIGDMSLYVNGHNLIVDDGFSV
jgi:NAD(P)-dependent dehydrogenase (short-subunit alcohol dehydrogenase family)